MTSHPRYVQVIYIFTKQCIWVYFVKYDLYVYPKNILYYLRYVNLLNDIGLSTSLASLLVPSSFKSTWTDHFWFFKRFQNYLEQLIIIENIFNIWYLVKNQRGISATWDLLMLIPFWKNMCKSWNVYKSYDICNSGKSEIYKNIKMNISQKTYVNLQYMWSLKSWIV